MKKFFAVIKREYLQRVRTRFFVVTSLVGPLMFALFGIVPLYIARMNIGGPTRLAVIDQSGKVYDRFREALLQTVDEDEDDELDGERADPNQQEQMQRKPSFGRTHFEVELVPSSGRPLEELKRELNERVRRNELDGYVVIPADILSDGTISVGDEVRVVEDDRSAVPDRA